MQGGQKKSDKQLIIKFLSEQFEMDRKYSEKEVNDIINDHHGFNDIPLLRRELVSRKFLARKDDCSLLESIMNKSIFNIQLFLCYSREQTSHNTVTIFNRVV